MRVTINGTPHEVDWELASYDDVVVLAGLDPATAPSVTYHGLRRGDSSRSGTMYPGCEPVALEDGMHFTAVHTGNA